MPVPYNKIFSWNRSSDVLIIDLGHLKITSDPEQERIVSTKVGKIPVYWRTQQPYVDPQFDSKSLLKIQPCFLKSPAISNWSPFPWYHCTVICYWICLQLAFSWSFLLPLASKRQQESTIRLCHFLTKFRNAQVIILKWAWIHSPLFKQ